jgi:eukaryotic-like serine/threonine-protein kinase
MTGGIVAAAALLLFGLRPRDPAPQPPRQTEAGANSGKGAAETPPISVPSSRALDALDPARIPDEERFDWQPPGLVAVLGHQRQRHWTQITALAVSPNGKRLASCDAAGALVLWDGDTMQRLASLPAGGANSVAFSVDGKRLATAGQLWDVSNDALRPVFELPHESDVVQQAFTPDGQFLIRRHVEGGDRDYLTLMDVSGSAAAERARLPRCLAFTLAPTGKMLAFLDRAGPTLRLFDMTALPSRERGIVPLAESDRAEHVPILAFLADGRLVTWVSGDTLSLWDVSGAEPVRQASAPAVTGPVFLDTAHGRNRFVTAAEQHWFRVWDVEGTELIQRMELADYLRSGSNVARVAMPADGNTFVTAHISGAIRLWDVSGSTVKERLPVPPQPAVPSRTYSGAVISGSGAFLALDDEALRTTVWRLDRGVPEPLESFRIPSTFLRTPLAFSPDGNTLAMADVNSRIHLLRRVGNDFRDRTVLPNPALSAAFSGDGRRLAIGGGERIEVWDVSGGDPALVASIEQPDPSYFVWLSHTGDRLVSAAAPGFGKVRLWNMTERGLSSRGEIPRSQGNLFTVPAISPDGNTLILGFQEGTLEVWDLARARPRLRATTTIAHGESIYSLRFLADGRTVVIGSLGGVYLWDSEEFVATRHWRFPGGVSPALVTADGRYIVSVNSNFTVYVFRTDGGTKDGRDEEAAP